MKNKKNLLLVIFLMIFSLFIYAQETSEEEIIINSDLSVLSTEETNEAETSIITEEPASADEDTVYVIRDINISIDGRTRRFALIKNGEFVEGERIIGANSLDKYIASKLQLLYNQRVLEEYSIEYSLGQKEEDGAIPVNLSVAVKDTWNIIVIPYPKYDSNDGFDITLKGRDYNFLGTMTALRIDLGYHQNDDEKTINFMIDSDTPFRAYNLDWNFNFDHTFSYTIGEPLYYQNVTGVSLELPWKFTYFTVGLNQFLTINESISDENIELYNPNSTYYSPYGSTEIFGSWKIPFGFEVGNFGELSYTTKITEMINYPFGDMDDPRKPVTSLYHSVGFGRVDWIGNYRKGLSASLSNTFNWYLNRTDAPLRISFDASVSFHWPFFKYLGLSSRFMYRQWWQWSEKTTGWIPYYYAGDVIRGVLNNDIRAEYMFSMNLDFPIRLLRFWPSEWFNKPKLHFFDFEVHLSPFVDVALLQGPYSELKDDYYEGSKFFSLSDMIATAGFEVIVFPGFLRSFYIRFSAGYNLRKIKDEGFSYYAGFIPKWDEIFIGVDHHY